MARHVDETSVRQQAFKLLDGMRDVERKVAIATIKLKFTLGDRYADTIYATHRQMGKDAGLYTTTYRMLEKKGVPYLSTSVVFNPAVEAFTNAEDAKIAYLDSLVKKIDAVNGLHK